MSYPKTIKQLIDCFKKFPGIGEKSAERMAFHTLGLEEDVINIFSEALLNSKKKIKKCNVCGNYTENDLCDICEDNTRNKKIICVLEDAKNINIFEKVGNFKGVYHILNGLISPLDGINPEDINIESLLHRIENDNVTEVILALKPTIEGETTSLYLSKLIDSNVIVSKIARGIPLGSDLEYIDSLTLERAIEDRKKID